MEFKNIIDYDEYEKNMKKQEKKAKNIIIENPREISHDIIGLELWEFEVLSGKDDHISDEAFCADEEIFLSFQGKEMRIYINEEGKLCIYTD